jgi:hypothetical protein
MKQGCQPGISETSGDPSLDSLPLGWKFSSEDVCVGHVLVQEDLVSHYPKRWMRK